MELIESPKSAYLLEASLEVFHFESNEWLSEIALWKDETAFFQKLLEIIAPKAKTPIQKVQLERLENKNIYYRHEVLNEMKNNVVLHEKYLSDLLDTTIEDSEQAYREKHKFISDNVLNFKSEFKNLKKQLFALSEEIL